MKKAAFRLLLLPLLLAAAAPAVRAGAFRPSAEPDLRVTGRLLEFNGAREVPRGLFGVHATPLTPEIAADWGVEADRRMLTAPSAALPTNRVTPRILECFFDRYQPALAVSRPADYEPFLTNLAAGCGQAAATNPAGRWIEFWNEPYLNWGIRPGVNYDGAFYEQADTAPGASMTLRGAKAPLPHLVWSRQLVAVDTNGRVNYVASRYLPAEIRDGQVFDWRGKPFRAEERPWGRDVTQHSFWAGRQNRAFYEAMVVPFARALKEADPAVELVAGWGFHLHQDGWKAWPELHRPLIDAAWPWIDGIGEHHYGGDTRLVAGSYETAWAYALTAHGKRLRFYNTEAGGMLDPEQPGSFKGRAEGEKAAEGALAYMVRDILHLVAACPDKAAARFAHESHHTSGDKLAFQLLKPLRGNLLECAGASADLLAAASLDSNRLVVALFNDSTRSRPFALSITAPGGTAFAGGECLRALKTDKGTLTLGRTPQPAAGRRLTLQVELKPREPATFVFNLAGSLSKPETVRLTQFPAAELLRAVTPDQPAGLSVRLPAALLEKPRGARLRIVQEGAPRGAVLPCTVNGRRLAFPIRASGIQEEPVPASWLTASNALEIACPPALSNGFRLCTASLILATP